MSQSGPLEDVLEEMQENEEEVSSPNKFTVAPDSSMNTFEHKKSSLPSVIENQSKMISDMSLAMDLDKYMKE